MKKITLLFLTFVFAHSFSQNEYTISFQDELINLPENIDSFQFNQLNDNTRIQQGFFTWIQFYQTPEQSVQEIIKDNRVSLIDYINNRTYLAFIPDDTSISFLSAQGVRSIVPVAGEYKLSPALKSGDIGDWAVVGDRILVTLQFHDAVTVDFVISDLANKQISVSQQWKGSRNIDLEIPNNCLEELSALPYVKWVEVIQAPSVKEDVFGRSLHRAAGLDTQTPTGRNYTGEGIGVLVRDDGIVGPHIDFQDRINNSLTAGIGQTHGDGVAGIMAGAGNLNPRNRGMAAGADVHVVTYVPSHLDAATTSLINDGTVQITNSSYGNGCNGGYTITTRTVDQQVIDNPSLIHVYSGGNSNNNDCGYGAGTQWGNITGGHKQGKNVIATANVFFNGSLVNSSSRGPAHDGRIKPDIAANGQNQVSTAENNTYQTFGGTSGAAPGIAGISAQLYEAYGALNGGALPNSALIKATLLNTANDAGNVGPDFRFGWGIVNGLRAGKLIEDERYLSDEIAQGETNMHTINVPSGTAQVRFMLYWKDVAAPAGASTALVNDLDLVVGTPGGANLLPWILDATPNPAALNTPATNGEDHLNNMEQVLINAPDAGNYTLDISGFNIPFGPQEYFIVYEIIEENLTVTYPNEGEHFVPGEQEVIHWDAINTTQNFAVEYSNDNGSTWNAIATVGSTLDLLIWTVPQDVTGEALVRVTSGSFSDTSDANFSIANLVTGLNITQACPEDATFEWNALAGAESYDLYILDGPYMEIVGSTTGTSVTVPISTPEEDIWYAVAANNATEGWKNRRTNAVLYSGGLLNCVLSNDLEVLSINSDSGNFSNACGDADGIVSATIQNNGVLAQTDFEVSYQLSGENIVIETFSGTLASGESIDYDFSTLLTVADTGNYTLTIATSIDDDEFVTNDSQSIEMSIQSSVQATPFGEDFETAGFPATGWNIENPDGEFTWEEASGVFGASGTPTIAGFIDNFAYNAQGSEDILTTLVFDLDINSPILTFDLAKAQFSAASSDGLRIEISTDCGTSFTTIYEKEGLELSTVGGFVTSSWVPVSTANWRTEEIDLTAYEGALSAIFRVINVGGFGNGTFVDNFNVDTTLAVEDVSLLNEVSVYPNPAASNVTITLPNINLNQVEVSVVNNQGQLIDSIKDTSGGENIQMDVSNYASGVYFVTINSGTSKTVKKLIVL